MTFVNESINEERKQAAQSNLTKLPLGGGGRTALTDAFVGHQGRNFRCSPYHTVDVEIDCDLNTADSLEFQAFVGNISDEAAVKAAPLTTIATRGTFVNVPDATGLAKAVPIVVQFEKTTWTQTFKAQLTVLVHGALHMRYEAKVTGAVGSAAVAVKVLGGKSL